MRNSFPVDSANLVELVIKALVAIPILCGYIRTKGEYEDLYKAFRPRVGQLLDKCLNFRKMVGEGFTSVDIGPYLYDPGEQYSPEFADLEYGEEESAGRRGAIAFTLGLGLARVSKSGDEEGNIRESREPILKPKVILQETLLEIIS